MTRSTGLGRIRRTAQQLADQYPHWTRKEEASCCRRFVDGLGRLPIGDCGPDCIRRRERLEHAATRGRINN